MIVFLGPDGTGKTTLAKRASEQFGRPYYHFTKDSGYRDYIPPLVHLDFTNAVLDRHAICELPYSQVMRRPFKFTLKQWHNILLMTLIQRPFIYLCTHKPLQYNYSPKQYLPYERWDECLRLYKEFLNSNLIPYAELDYTKATLTSDELERSAVDSGTWWRAHWRAGYGCTGSAFPKILLVAERIGPNNVNNIPFETGPTGLMLSELLYNTRTPLGAIAVTNMVKSFRGDSRKPNDRDLELLREEIVNLKPRKVVFMGTPAKQGIPLARELGCDVDTIVHLGSLNHRGVKDMSGYYNEWKKIIGVVPKVAFK